MVRYFPVALSLSCGFFTYLANFSGCRVLEVERGSNAQVEYMYIGTVH